MPQTAGGGSRQPEVQGGERDSQQAANDLRAANQEQFDVMESQYAQIGRRAPSRTEGIKQGQGVAGPQDASVSAASLGVEFDDTIGSDDIIPQYANEDEEFLFGMTDRPDEPGWAGASARPQPPRDIHRYLGALVDASGDPNAPQELFQFMRVLQELLSE